MRKATRSHLLVAGLMIGVVGLTSIVLFAQDEEVWIDSFTIDGSPVGGDLAPQPTLASRPPEAASRHQRPALWRVLGALLRPASPSVRATYREPGALAAAGPAAPLTPRHSRSSLAAGASGPIDLRCSAGAYSGNPERDIYLTVEIWVQDSGKVASANGHGPWPEAVAEGTVDEAGYDRWVQCYAQAGIGGASASGTILATAIPTGETTSSSGWWAGGTTIHKWTQTLSGGTFTGRQVWESDPGGGGPDTCWYPQSQIAKAESITGASWSVDANSNWGPDLP